MDDVPEPRNAGEEPPPGRRSKEFGVYHRFHGYTTSNCRNVRKIILQMIEQGKLDHFLLNQPRNPPPPPPQGNKYVKEDRSTFVIDVGAKANNLYCNSIIHSFKNIEDFHDNILSRVYARDAEGREIFNLEKIPSLKNWQKKKISFSTDEIPEAKTSHECPLVVRLGINPKTLDEDEEENEKNTWGVNRILIDTGSSVDVLFYHTYKTMGGRDDELIPSTYKIYGFNGSANKPNGEVTMQILLQSLPTDITFCVVDVESPYNALIGRLHSILAVASTFHQCIKFPLPQGVGIIRGDTVESKNCQEIDIDRCEARESKRRNWQKNAADSKRAERLMVDV
ncbi:uncharacterized protein LOC113325311 [Papaver somniferum]|uniref:uncharacterized protein LOC113325311 n=1 Tax=Papaver somniferum TaxID=3469 RepID=UPI000E6FBF6D|nr:uncharacterized protein LOC113325311 [Papaver somniferum]